MRFDVVIPWHPKDLSLGYCIAGIKQHVKGAKRVFVICASSAFPNLDDICATKSLTVEQWPPNNAADGFVYSVDEDALFPGLTIADLFARGLPGWCWQQILKLGVAFVPQKLDLSPYYLVVDSDVIFIKDTEFFTPDGAVLMGNHAWRAHDGKPGGRMDKYAPVMKSLFGLEDDYMFCWIVHHMMFNVATVKDMWKIETVKDYVNKVQTIKKEQWEQFSEYQCYGHFQRLNRTENTHWKLRDNSESIFLDTRWHMSWIKDHPEETDHLLTTIQNSFNPPVYMCACHHHTNPMERTNLGPTTPRLWVDELYAKVKNPRQVIERMYQLLPEPDEDGNISVLGRTDAKSFLEAHMKIQEEWAHWPSLLK